MSYLLTFQVSVFRNEYVAEREEKKAVMEQHVQLSNSVISSAETQGINIQLMVSRDNEIDYLLSVYD